MFLRIAGAFSWASGHPITTFAVILFMTGWFLSGPFVGWSSTWQEVAGVGFEAISVLMLFLLHSSSVRENKSLNLKLDELIRVHKDADNHLIHIERSTEQELYKYDAFEERERQ